MATKRNTTNSKLDPNPDSNPDPITGEPGAHPVGVGVGTAAGGAAAGAVAGMVAGPVGAVVGALVGGVAGGYGGKAIAESIDPTVEHAYWEKNYQSRPYVDKAAPYDTYRPAYQYGMDARSRYPGKKFDDVETDLASGWQSTGTKTKLGWDKAKLAARDAWDHVERALPAMRRRWQVIERRAAAQTYPIRDARHPGESPRDLPGCFCWKWDEHRGGVTGIEQRVPASNVPWATRGCFDPRHSTSLGE